MDDYTVYVFDRRTDLPASYPIHAAAEDTARALQLLDLRDIFLFGASQGGMMAMDLAVHHPDLIRGLILGSTASRMPEARCRVIDHWIDLARQGKAEALYLDFAEKIYPESVFQQYRAHFRNISKEITQRDLDHFTVLAEGIHGFDDCARLKEISCPVLLLGSKDDAVLGEDAFCEIKKELNGKLGFASHRYDGFGHASFDTAPDYLDRIRTFLNTI